MERELAIEFARVTEAAALNSARWMGKGDKIAADDAAVKAMRSMFDTIHIEGKVVIGEGEMDEAPMLYIGEKVGLGEGVKVDIAVDPLEGTNLVAKGMNGAIAVMAVAKEDCLLHAPDMYMDKIAVGPLAVGAIDLDASPEENVRNVAQKLGKKIEEVTVVILDRPRHQKIINAIRKAGARIKLITDGDVSPVVATAIPDSGVDMVIGIGGAPEGVLAAAALKCMGGDMRARLIPENEEELRRMKEMGITDTKKVLTIDDLVKTDEVVFVATGITDGETLKGVRFFNDRATTHTVVMRGKTGTIRFIEAYHYFSRKPHYVRMDG
ncbi:fructose-1,6-bisphosphatase II [Desulfonispora thiosulfatigenes DSM 11270]|uniref:Fructose-1,6-bisphosphatase n=1 Tax=Desulfonispora thiosulfatigenes DSM 11270 TaxID=656914 RepID=A0A1W1UYZ4_DESTI|nr:class II fructose-bisphosphatase [Desulfonispora thiosulfatigenes]SMB86286.1 fructose-1,6-bisphosphatase II [Desulfonispora thiosulfatigenes DSM 11270]